MSWAASRPVIWQSTATRHSAYTHRYEKLLKLQQQFGIIPCKTIAEAVQDADYIFVMVGYPSDVKEVFLATGAASSTSAKPGALAIDYDHLLALAGTAAV